MKKCPITCVYQILVLPLHHINQKYDMGKTKYIIDKSELYQKYIIQNLSQKELSLFYNVPVITIIRRLRKYKISKLTEERKLSIEEVNVEKIQELILQNLTHQQIADKLNIPRGTLRNILYTNFNITNNLKFSNTINEKIIEKEDSFYWYLIGLISSDGHLVNKNNWNSVSIYQKNADFLKKIKDKLEHQGKLYQTKDKLFTLCINSKILSDKLKSYGFTSDKRYNVPFLNVPVEFIKDYVLGIFDGDGCIYFNYTSDKPMQKCFQITTGSENLANGLMKILIKFNPVKYNKISTVENNYYDIKIQSEQDIFNIFNWLYSNENKEFCLKRKYNLFIKFKMVYDIYKLMI